MTQAKTSTGALLDALREPGLKTARTKMSMSALTNLRRLMAALKAEIAANTGAMTPEQRQKISELARALEAHLSML